MTKPALVVFSSCAAAACLVLGACQTTQETSQLREESGEELISSEKGVRVTKQNPDVEILQTKVLTDAAGSAVVVELRNKTQNGLAKLPIAIDVRDAKGKTIFKNNLPGLDPALTTVPLMKPGETVDWVHDQILANGKPASVKVKVGDPSEQYPPEPPEIELTEPKGQPDSSGFSVIGEAAWEGLVQRDLTLFAVARKGDEIVAAGRGGIERLPKPSGRPQEYQIFFIGNPDGAEVNVAAPPSVLSEG